ANPNAVQIARELRQPKDSHAKCRKRGVFRAFSGRIRSSAGRSRFESGHLLSKLTRFEKPNLDSCGALAYPLGSLRPGVGGQAGGPVLDRRRRLRLGACALARPPSTPATVSLTAPPGAERTILFATHPVRCKDSSHAYGPQPRSHSDAFPFHRHLRAERL